jgi:hypothetical protein
MYILRDFIDSAPGLGAGSGYLVYKELTRPPLPR